MLVGEISVYFALPDDIYVLGCCPQLNSSVLLRKAQYEFIFHTVQNGNFIFKKYDHKIKKYSKTSFKFVMFDKCNKKKKQRDLWN